MSQPLDFNQVQPPPPPVAGVSPQPPPAPPPAPPPSPQSTVGYYGQPLPVQPLSYGSPMSGGRPGILTAVGVLSIIVSSLSILWSLIIGFMTFAFLMMATTLGAMRRTSTVAAAPGPPPRISVTSRAGGAALTPPPSPLTVGPRGLEAGPRQLVIQGMVRVRPLGPARQQMLDALLADSGMEMFPFDPSQPSVTPQMIANNVSESGRLPSAGRGAGPDYFVLANGRLELYDDHAVFSPSDGRDTIRVSKDDLASASGLSANDIESIVVQAQSLCNNGLTPAQTAAIKTLLTAPGQTYVSKTGVSRGTPPPPQQLYQVTVQPSGTAMLIFTGGQAMIAKDGSMLSTFSYGAGGMGPGGMPAFNLSKPAATAVIAECALSGVLAIYLLVIGILVLRQNPRGRVLHNLYALLKIPLVVVAVIATYKMWSSFSSGPFGPASGTMGVTYATLAALGGIYPIALLITFQTRGVRSYYNSVR